MPKDYVAIARQYADDVLSEKIPACRLVQLACQRQLDDLAKAAESDVDWRWSWDPELASKICKFLEKLPHIRGRGWKSRTLELEPWQCFVLTTLFGWVDEDGMRRFRKCFIEIPRKNGKALALDTPIPTPTGWTTMGAVEVGDKVLGEDGLPCMVTATSDVFYGHDCYRLTFSNDETVVADAGHIWVTTAKVDNPGDQKHRKFPRWSEPSISVQAVGNHKYAYANLWQRQVSLGRIDDQSYLQRFEDLRAADLAKHPVQSSIMRRERTTEEIFKTQRYGKRRDVNHSISLPAALELPEAELSVDPYLLGVWLGDGSSNSAIIHAGDRDKDEIAGYIRALGYEVLEHRRRTVWTLQVCARDLDGAGVAIRVTKASSKNLVKRLRAIGVINNKHIPAEYLRSSKSQRLELLQGLMDTDGTIASSGRVLSYTTVSKLLADNVSELLSSLGIKHSMRAGAMTCNGRSVPGTSYDIQFMAFRDDLPVFRLTRKLVRMRFRSDCKIEPRSKTVQIKEVSKIDSIPTKCIAVDSPSRMYLFGRTMLPTHNTIIAAGVALYLLCADGEPGADIFSAAVTKDQAKLAWETARQMVLLEPLMRDHFGIQAMKQSIVLEKSASSYKPLARDTDTLEGLSPHGAIIDELHVHKTRELFDVLNQATGSRRQALLFCITTAGDNRNGICYEQHDYLIQILNGRHDDDRYFGIIYTIDPEDDWTTEEAARKANPNYGISVLADDFQTICKQAQRSAGAQNDFLTKRLNVWVSTGTAYFNMLAWHNRCAVPGLKLEDFYGEQCLIALDLATRVDIAAKVYLFRREGIRYVFGKYYLPTSAAERGNPNYDLYSGWAKSDDVDLTLTDGAEIDFETIETELLEDRSNFHVLEFPYDPYQATEISQRMRKENLNMVEVQANVRSFSEPMKSLDGMILQGKIKHNGDPILSWMMGNVYAKRDHKDNVYPRKVRNENKIDGAVALIMGLSREMLDSGESVYEGRGLITI